MGPRLRSSFIFTTTARIDTSASRLWPVLGNPRGWPGWWTAITRCDIHAGLAAPPQRAPPSGRWRLAWGLPLKLRVTALASELPDWQSWRLQGDLQGQLVFTVQPACDAGNAGDERQPSVELTCRCELPGVRMGSWPWGLLLERRIGRLSQRLVRDLGQVLHCQARVLAHWPGSAWRG